MDSVVVVTGKYSNKYRQKKVYGYSISDTPSAAESVSKKSLRHQLHINMTFWQSTSLNFE